MEASSDPNAKEGEGASCVAREEEPFATSAGVGGWLESSPLLPTPGSADLDLAKPFPHAPLLAEALAPSPPPHPPFFALGPPGVADGVEACACEPGRSSRTVGPGGADAKRTSPGVPIGVPSTRSLSLSLYRVSVSTGLDGGRPSRSTGAEDGSGLP